MDRAEQPADWSQVLDDESTSAIVAYNEMDDEINDMDEAQADSNQNTQLYSRRQNMMTEDASNKNGGTERTIRVQNHAIRKGSMTRQIDD